MNSGERKVVWCESVLLPNVIRRAAANVLFTGFNVPHIVPIPSEVAAMVPLALSSALVVDIGFKHSCVLPVSLDPHACALCACYGI